MEGKHIVLTETLIGDNLREKMLILVSFLRCFSQRGKGVSEFMAIGMCNGGCPHGRGSESRVSRPNQGKRTFEALIYCQPRPTS